MKVPILPLGGWVEVELEVTDAVQRRAQQNHYQTLERLVQRGGLGWRELLAIVEDVDFRTIQGNAAECRVRVLHHELVTPVGCGGCQAWGVPPSISHGRCTTCDRTEEEIRAASKAAA